VQKRQTHYLIAHHNFQITPIPTAHHLKQPDCREFVYFLNALRTVRNSRTIHASSFKSSLIFSTFHYYIQAYIKREALMGSTGIIFQGGWISGDKIKRNINFTVLWWRKYTKQMPHRRFQTSRRLSDLSCLLYECNWGTF
jgi:hypothetical protein